MAVERGRASQRSHGLASMRSSQRSYGTSSSSSQHSRIKCKNCCRKFVSFMCTQVGVGGLVVSYAIVGSFAFMAIEGDPDYTLTNKTVEVRNMTIKTLWNVTEKLNILDKENWYGNISKNLLEYQNVFVDIIKQGYDGRNLKEVWTFPASLMFCLSVFTMIGYGHMTPKTELGKITTILYAVFGIPLYIVYFMNMGKVFAKSFKLLYRLMYRCIHRKKGNGMDMENGEDGDDDDDDDEDDDDSEEGFGEPTIIVPSTACMWVMIFYMATGTIMFAEWENWTYLNSCYFSFTSLAKIGIGDLVPGFGEEGATEDSQTKLIINFMYLLIGMGLIAMCYTLMKEEIMLRLRTLKQDLKEKLFVCGLRLGLYVEESVPPPVPKISHQRSKTIRKSVRRR